mmetsp:Transcript_29926/g.69206  ORF Transcript_29926/g.69206 Transcript_29926/m.69206 type:complete len:231 (-) Transcript_29926:929-1621(-)
MAAHQHRSHFRSPTASRQSGQMPNRHGGAGWSIALPTSFIFRRASGRRKGSRFMKPQPSATTAPCDSLSVMEATWISLARGHAPLSTSGHVRGKSKFARPSWCSAPTWTRWTLAGARPCTWLPQAGWSTSLNCCCEDAQRSQDWTSWGKLRFTMRQPWERQTQSSLCSPTMRLQTREKRRRGTPRCTLRACTDTLTRRRPCSHTGVRPADRISMGTQLCTWPHWLATRRL